jgi:hypothetical protein
MHDVRRDNWVLVMGIYDVVIEALHAAEHRLLNQNLRGIRITLDLPRPEFVRFITEAEAKGTVKPGRSGAPNRQHNRVTYRGHVIRTEHYQVKTGDQPEIKPKTTRG